MGAVLQFAAFLCICWLIRGVIAHPNQDDNKKLTNKPPNQNNAGGRDFYFEEQRTNEGNIKTGRAIPQSAWSKEEKEQTQTAQNKTGTQSNDEFSLKNIISYMLNMVQELKKDIFGIKEMASFKNKEEIVNSQDNFEDKNKQNKIEVRNDAPKSSDSPEHYEFNNENQQPRSNYLTDYYQKNGIKFVDGEEEDDDLENFSDQSDDSSHQPNEEFSIQEININNKNRNQNDDSSHKPNDGVNKQEIIKNNKNTYSYKCVRITRKPGIYSEVEKITTIPTSQKKIPEENVKKFDDNKENGKDYNFKASTTKPSTAERNNLKSSRKETENLTTAPSTSKMGKCVKKNNRNSINNLNEKNYPAEKPLKSVEYVTTKNPQNENSDKTNSKRPNQNKTPDNLPKVTSPSSKNPGKNSKNKNATNFDNKSGAQPLSTTLSSQNSKEFTYPEKVGNANEPYTSGMFSEKPAYRKQEQNTSPKPADEKQIQNDAKSLKNTVRANENVTVSTPNLRMSTKTYTLGTEINDNLKESKDKRSNVISSLTTITYNEDEPNSKFDGQQNNVDSDSTIQSTTSGNIMNMDKVNKNISDNFTDKKGTNKNDESEKLNANNKDKSGLEDEGNGETEQPKEQQTNNDPEPEISLKNKKIRDSKPGNNIKEAGDNLSSTTPSVLYSSQDSKSEFQNHDSEGFDKPQESNENLSENEEMQEISPDQEYEYEDDTEDFDISEEIMNMQDIQNQESEVNINNGKYENNDKINPTTVLINESQISKQTGYAMKEESEEQYGTFLEYIYKHSNNSFFQSLKSQSNNSSHGGY